MARTYIIAKARKSPGTCRACGKVINIGDSYKWAKPRYRGKVIVCSSCQITLSMTSSSKMVACWEAQEAIEQSDTAGLVDTLNDAASTAREVGEEYQEACDNQREYFPDSEVAEENEERAQELEEWADTLEEAASDVEATISEIEELDNEKGVLETELDVENTTDNRKDEIQKRLDEIESEREDKEQEALDKASEASGECP